MFIRKRFSLLLVLFLIPRSQAAAQAPTGTLRGVVTLEDTGKPVHGVTVTLLQLRRSIITGDDGAYEFKDVPAGTYDVDAHLERVPDVVKTVEVTAGGDAELPFQLRLRAMGIQVTVTATGNEESSLRAVQPVNSLSAMDLIDKNPMTLGDALDRELGVAKRTFGPGTSRPVLRGFDGDRVLILEDGNRIGALGFQSGDHAEPVDVMKLDKLEVVKGPATLLYGSNAIGGVVNAITGHESAHPGARGYLTGIAGSNNNQAGGSGGIEFGTEKWLFWGSGSGQRASDYQTPIGTVPNSYARDANGGGGLGYYPKGGFFSVDYEHDRRRYGIPFDSGDPGAETVFLNPRRHSVRFNGGLHDRSGFISGAQFSLGYNDYKHEETDAETKTVNTSFHNQTTNYRGVVDQSRRGHWSGTFGVSGYHRDYTSSGEEALAPPTLQNSFALFMLEKLDFESLTLQAGGRFEHNGYDPTPLPTRSTPERAFNGFSGSAGMRLSIGKRSAFAANYSHSYRAPSLEELYNLGPHAGNFTFEIGDPRLKRELGDGIDLSLRHDSGRLRGELNYFYYHIADFIYLAPTGNIEDGLIEANYAQGNSRYTGAEARLEVGLHRNIWLLSKVDYVNAQLTTGTPLPRIPPLRGSVGVEATFKGLRVHPEIVMTNEQTRLFTTEDRTPGYAVFNLGASYTLARQHHAHVFSFNTFNVGDVLYRNHLSFIKEFAPEIGRGVRFTYTMRFF